MVEYLDGPIIKDIKNIPYQNFEEKYCKQMQISVTFGSVDLKRCYFFQVFIYLDSFVIL